MADPREALRRLREAHEEGDGDCCTLEKRTLLALLDVAEAAASVADHPRTHWRTMRLRAALARLGEE